MNVDFFFLFGNKRKIEEYLIKRGEPLIDLFSSTRIRPFSPALDIVYELVCGLLLLSLEKVLLLILRFLVLLNIRIIGEPDFDIKAQEVQSCSYLPFLDDPLDKFFVLVHGVEPRKGLHQVINLFLFFRLSFVQNHQTLQVEHIPVDYEIFSALSFLQPEVIDVKNSVFHLGFGL